MSAKFICHNCGQDLTGPEDDGECFGHWYAEPGWPVWHTPEEVVA